jgi:hypothetical protein
MPNNRKRTAADRSRTRAARAIQRQAPGMKYTDALREADRLAELRRADAAAVIDDDIDDGHFPPAGPDYPAPAAVLDAFRQPPAGRRSAAELG